MGDGIHAEVEADELDYIDDVNSDGELDIQLQPSDDDIPNETQVTSEKQTQ